MKNLFAFVLSLSSLFGAGLLANHHHHDHVDHSNPPCNHESLEDARTAEEHGR